MFDLPRVPIKKENRWEAIHHYNPNPNIAEVSAPSRRRSLLDDLPMPERQESVASFVPKPDSTTSLFSYSSTSQSSSYPTKHSRSTSTSTRSLETTLLGEGNDKDSHPRQPRRRKNHSPGSSPSSGSSPTSRSISSKKFQDLMKLSSRSLLSNSSSGDNNEYKGYNVSLDNYLKSPKKSSSISRIDQWFDAMDSPPQQPNPADDNDDDTESLPQEYLRKPCSNRNMISVIKECHESVETCTTFSETECTGSEQESQSDHGTAGSSSKHTATTRSGSVTTTKEDEEDDEMDDELPPPPSKASRRANEAASRRMLYRSDSSRSATARARQEHAPREDGAGTKLDRLREKMKRLREQSQRQLVESRASLDRNPSFSQRSQRMLVESKASALDRNPSFSKRSRKLSDRSKTSLESHSSSGKPQKQMEDDRANASWGENDSEIPKETLKASNKKLVSNDTMAILRKDTLKASNKSPRSRRERNVIPYSSFHSDASSTAQEEEEEHKYDRHIHITGRRNSMDISARDETKEYDSHIQIRVRKDSMEEEEDEASVDEDATEAESVDEDATEAESVDDIEKYEYEYDSVETEEKKTYDKHIHVKGRRDSLEYYSKEEMKGLPKNLPLIAPDSALARASLVTATEPKNLVEELREAQKARQEEAGNRPWSDPFESKPLASMDSLSSRSLCDSPICDTPPKSFRSKKLAYLNNIGDAEESRTQAPFTTADWVLGSLPETSPLSCPSPTPNTPAKHARGRTMARRGSITKMMLDNSDHNPAEPTTPGGRGRTMARRCSITKSMLEDSEHNPTETDYATPVVSNARRRIASPGRGRTMERRCSQTQEGESPRQQGRGRTMARRCSQDSSSYQESAAYRSPGPSTPCTPARHCRGRTMARRSSINKASMVVPETPTKSPKRWMTASNVEKNMNVDVHKVSPKRYDNKMSRKLVMRERKKEKRPSLNDDGKGKPHRRSWKQHQIAKSLSSSSKDREGVGRKTQHPIAKSHSSSSKDGERVGRKLYGRRPSSDKVDASKSAGRKFLGMKKSPSSRFVAAASVGKDISPNRPEKTPSRKFLPGIGKSSSRDKQDGNKKDGKLKRSTSRRLVAAASNEKDASPHRLQQQRNNWAQRKFANRLSSWSKEKEDQKDQPSREGIKKSSSGRLLGGKPYEVAKRPGLTRKQSSRRLDAVMDLRDNNKGITRKPYDILKPASRKLIDDDDTSQPSSSRRLLVTVEDPRETTEEETGVGKQVESFGWLDAGVNPGGESDDIHDVVHSAYEMAKDSSHKKCYEIFAGGRDDSSKSGVESFTASFTSSEEGSENSDSKHGKRNGKTDAMSADQRKARYKDCRKNDHHKLIDMCNGVV